LTAVAARRVSAPRSAGTTAAGSAAGRCAPARSAAGGVGTAATLVLGATCTATTQHAVRRSAAAALGDLVLLGAHDGVEVAERTLEFFVTALAGRVAAIAVPEGAVAAAFATVAGTLATRTLTAGAAALGRPLVATTAGALLAATPDTTGARWPRRTAACAAVAATAAGTARAVTTPAAARRCAATGA
jgi:hypothetical protein